jgi:hypothetical protein
MDSDSLRKVTGTRLKSFVYKTLLTLFVLFQNYFAHPLALASQNSASAISSHQANLQLTHFLFTHVIESFLEEGDRFITESIFGNGERSYEYLLEKKVLVSFLKEWQRQLERTDISNENSFQIFQRIFSDSPFLKTNAFYILTTLGIAQDFSKLLDHHLMKSGPERMELSFAPGQVALLNKNRLSPFQAYPVNLGYARVPLLTHILASEKIDSDEKRALTLLDEMARLMSYERDDRKTIVWMTAFFLNNHSEVVAQKARAVLGNIDKNEFVDAISDARWLILGGRYFWSQREKVLEGLKFLGQTEKAQRLGAWLAFLTAHSVKIANTTKDAVILSALSVYRYLKTLHPMVWSGGISVGAHLGFYHYFIKAPLPENTFEADLKKALFALSISDGTTAISEGQEWSPINSKLEKYSGKSKYADLRKFDTTPLEVLNAVAPTDLKDPDVLLREGKVWLEQNRNHKHVSFNYGSYFLQDEYYRSLASSKLKDLRLISVD